MPSLADEIAAFLDEKVAQLQARGHATPDVEVGSAAYRWYRKTFGDVRCHATAKPKRVRGKK